MSATDILIDMEEESLPKERCENCVHFKWVKELKNNTWHWFNICDLFINKKDGWGIVVTDNDFCEVFEEK